MNKLCTTLISAAICIAFCGCGKSKTVTETVYTDVNKIFVCTIGYNSEAYLTSVPTADTALTTLKMSWDVTLITFKENLINGGISFTLPDGTPYPPSYPAIDIDVSLTSNIGNCQGIIKIPRYINSFTPSYGDTFPLGDVLCNWSKAVYAEWYSIYCYYTAYDSAGNWLRSNEYYAYSSDTSHTISSSNFNSTAAKYYSVSLQVTPSRGVKPVAGSTGNMTGTVNGFLISEGSSRGAYFYVGTPLKNIKLPKTEHKQPGSKDRMKRYIQTIVAK